MWGAVGDPIVNIFNHLIDQYNSFLDSVAGTSKELSGLTDGAVQPIVISHASNIDTAKPAFLGAASGGTFGPGGLIVGERGPELIAPSERITVFPNQATRDIQQLRTMLQGHYQQPIYNTTNNHYSTYNISDDHTMNVTIQGNSNNED